MARQIVDDGANADELADSLGFSRAAVFSWAQQYRAGGIEALHAKPIPGRPKKLTEEQADRIYAILYTKTPDQMHFDFQLWTRWMVRDLIQRLLGISITEQAVGRMLRRWGMSPQRPVTQAIQRDEEKVMRWKTEQFPRIRAEARKVGATVYFGDEASVRTDHHSGTTWAPVGETPVVSRTGDRKSVLMLSAVSAQGKLHFMLQQGGSVDSKVFIEFCSRLLHDDGGNVFLIVDGAKYHDSKAVREFVASTQGRLRIFRLPPYAPDTNPDEWVWNNVKTAKVGRKMITSVSDLYSNVLAALRRLQENPGLVMGFFGDPHLAYINW
ncbi:IS630 family transposase [Frankia sp. AgPm24]|nr:IS630 family transposase [Frankia sp. AgPm24]MCK9924316.1 IS630 family transposase [Frankia sp. AgPm24]